MNISRQMHLREEHHFLNRLLLLTVLHQSATNLWTQQDPMQPILKQHLPLQTWVLDQCLRHTNDGHPRSLLIWSSPLSSNHSHHDVGQIHCNYWIRVFFKWSCLTGKWQLDMQVSWRTKEFLAIVSTVNFISFNLPSCYFRLKICYTVWRSWSFIAFNSTDFDWSLSPNI